MRSGLVPIAALTLVAGSGAGCTEDHTPAVSSTVRTYVAMGDSYTAGSGLPERISESDPCWQSRLSYPRLVAEELGAELDDASCGGARTDHVTAAQPRGGMDPWPPQLDAVRKDTDLVTLSFGYNDLAFLVEVLLTCTNLAASAPTGSPCTDDRDQPGGFDAEAAAHQIDQRLGDAIDVVRERAPEARVLVVGYPQLVPDSGTCPELPLAEGDYAFVAGQLRLLDEAQRHAADAAGVTFVDVMAASRGHDICAGEDAWVSGAAAVPGQEAAYHPFAQAQEAVAELVLEALDG